MTDEDREQGGAACDETVNITPQYINACLEEKLTHLVPIFECVNRQLTQFHSDLRNGYFSFEKIWARVLARENDS